jgi:DNA (cytosine-5)-methyltransferase 1
VTRLLDLFCGAGGAAVGYHRAGFTEIVGVDIKPQPRFPYAFVLMDALKALEVLLAGGYITDNNGRQWHLADFYSIHASPPCQEYSQIRGLRNANAPIKGYHIRFKAKLIEPVREALIKTGTIWVIENVRGAPMPSSIYLCGSMFGLPIQRHRLFESSIALWSNGSCQHGGGSYNAIGGRIRGNGSFRSTTRVYVDKRGYHRRGEGIAGKAVGEKAMGIDWMTVKEMCEAIPPAYTEYIGRQLLEAIAGGNSQ